MKLAYVDSSWLLAIAFEEPGCRRREERLTAFDQLYASNLVEAEVRSALAREAVPEGQEGIFRAITWLYPTRPLSREFRGVMTYGHLKGADLWHLACALFVSPDPGEITFLTLDRRQKEVARRVGFAV